MKDCHLLCGMGVSGVKDNVVLSLVAIRLRSCFLSFRPLGGGQQKTAQLSTSLHSPFLKIKHILIFTHLFLSYLLAFSLFFSLLNTLRENKFATVASLSFSNFNPSLFLYFSRITVTDIRDRKVNLPP